MKRISILTGLMCLSVLIANSHNEIELPIKKPTKKIEPVARWTGTLKRDEKITHSNEVVSGTVVRHAEVFFTAAMPTMNRDDGLTEFNYTDDKGSGTHTLHADFTRLLLKQKCVYDCTGSGTAELHTVIIREWENTYDIEAISPVCKGTDCEGNPFEETITITVSNEPFSNRDVLSGTKTVTAELPGGLGTGTATTTWHLTRVKEDNDVELIVTPVNYETWVPEPGRNELSKGKVMTINLKLQGKNGKPLKVKAESFELRLNNTSKEPGITINYPIEPDPNQLSDLRFLHLTNIESIEEDQFITVGSPDGVSGTAYIGSYDGGGWTTLTAEAILTDKRHIKGNLIVSGGDEDILIPKRIPGNKVALAWAKANGNPQDMDDKEKLEDNSNDGDGLTAYEEYRGVICQGKFKRLDPQKKEVGVDVISPELSFFEEGIKWFENASSLRAIIFHEDLNEIGIDRRLNKNGLTNHDYDQYVLRLYKLVIPSGALGKAYGGPAVPAKTFAVVIDYQAIQNDYTSWVTDARKMGVVMPFTLDQFLAKTIAHELGHGVNCRHHGTSGSFYWKDIIQPDSKYVNTTVHIFVGGKEVTTRPYQVEGSMGKSGNQESGNISCIMTYFPWCQWCIDTEGNVHYYSRVPLLSLGTILCKSGKGTNFNAHPNFFGDTPNGRGNCWGQIKLKD